MTPSILQLLPDLRHRRGMFISDQSFGALSAFISGMNMLTGEVPMNEFARWLHERYGVPGGGVTWDWLIARRVGLENGTWQEPALARDWEREGAACEELLDRLEEFLGSRIRPFLEHP